MDVASVPGIIKRNSHLAFRCPLAPRAYQRGDAKHDRADDEQLEQQADDIEAREYGPRLRARRGSETAIPCA